MKNKKNIKEAVEGSYDFRLNAYEEIIEKNLKSGESTAILFPTIDSAIKSFSILKKDYREKAISFHGKITKKTFQKNVAILKENKPLIVVLTGNFLVLLSESIKTLIVEEENSRWHKMRNRPFLNFRKIAEEFASQFSIDILYGDVLFSSETYLKIKEYKKQPRRNLDTLILVSKSKSEEEKTYDPLDKETEKEINKTLYKKKNIFIWTIRKGYAPIVLCHHCGATVKCNKCDSPIVLHKSIKGEENYFLCHHCGEKRSALEKCSNCNSWKLGSFGIGVERIEEEVKKKWPKEYEDGLIEIGTEKSVNGLTNVYDLIIVPSIDSLLALPDFNIDERLLRMILILKERTKRLFIIKTKYKDLNILEYLKKENLRKFHDEIEEKRKKFGYNPFKVLIKITIKGKKPVVSKEIESIKKDLEKWKPNVFPAFIKTINNQFIMHLLIRIDNDMWPNKELSEYLKGLPPSIEINVDPESLL